MVKQLQAVLWISFFFLLLTSCRNVPVDDAPAKPVCNTPQIIRGIYKQFVYDLSGYENSGGGGAFNLFDENEYFDPKNGIKDLSPQTSPQPIRNGDSYFKKGKGNRIVVDLRIPYKLSEVYLFDGSAIQDTVWIYTGDMSNWKLKQTIVTTTEAITRGWKKFALSDSTQFVMFRFNSNFPNIKEAVLYGCPLQAVPPPPVTSGYDGPRLPKKALKDFLGVNMYNETPLEWMEPFKWVRMYTTANYFDIEDSNAYPNGKISVSRFGYLYQGDSFRHYSDDLAALDKKMWYSVRGTPVWMNKLNMWDFDRPVTKLGQDPEDPMSYGRHAYMMWTLAATFGKTAVDTNLLNVADMIRTSGKGTMTLYENGNEEDAWWVGNKFGSPMEYFAQSSADYDGHMGKLGEKHGIATADSNSKLILSGTVGLDTNRVRILDFLCRHLRPDKKFLWEGGIQYHHYSTDVGSSIAPNMFQRATSGITPEEDNLRERLTKVRDYTYRLRPGVECILGEYGFDKNQKSTQATPLIPGYTPAQSQGIMLLRSINAVAFSGFDKLILYWMKDHETEQSTFVYLTSGLVYQGMDGKITPYASWFHVAAMMHHLGAYVPDRIVSEKGNVWIYQYRHQSQPDSLAWFVYAPTRKADKYAGYELNVPVASGNAELVQFDETKTGRIERRVINDHKIKVDVTAVPVIVKFSEK